MVNFILLSVNGQLYLAGLWCLSAIFNTISAIYRRSQFYWRRKPEYPEKTTDLAMNGDSNSQR